jgi:hypothetical protein
MEAFLEDARVELKWNYVLSNQNDGEAERRTFLKEYGLVIFHNIRSVLLKFGE